MIPVETTLTSPFWCRLQHRFRLRADRGRIPSLTSLAGLRPLPSRGLAMLAALSTGLLCFRFVVETAGPRYRRTDKPRASDLARSTWPTSAMLGVPARAFCSPQSMSSPGFRFFLWARGPHTAFLSWIFFRHRACWVCWDRSCSESSRCSVAPNRRYPVEVIVCLLLLRDWHRSAVWSRRLPDHGHRCATASWVAMDWSALRSARRPLHRTDGGGAWLLIRSVCL